MRLIWLANKKRSCAAYNMQGHKLCAFILINIMLDRFTLLISRFFAFRCRPQLRTQVETAVVTCRIWSHWLIKGGLLNVSFDQYSFQTKRPFFAKKKLSFAKLSPAGSRNHFLSMEYLVVRFCKANKNMSLLCSNLLAIRAVLFPKVYSLQWFLTSVGAMFFLYRVSFRGSFAILSSKHTSISADFFQNYDRHCSRHCMAKQHQRRCTVYSTGKYNHWLYDLFCWFIIFTAFMPCQNLSKKTEKKKTFATRFAKLSRTTFEALRWPSLTKSSTRTFWSILMYFLHAIPWQWQWGPLPAKVFIMLHNLKYLNKTSATLLGLNLPSITVDNLCILLPHDLYNSPIALASWAQQSMPTPPAPQESIIYDFAPSTNIDAKQLA